MSWRPFYGHFNPVGLIFRFSLVCLGFCRKKRGYAGCVSSKIATAQNEPVLPPLGAIATSLRRWVGLASVLTALPWPISSRWGSSSGSGPLSSSVGAGRAARHSAHTRSPSNSITEARATRSPPRFLAHSPRGGVGTWRSRSACRGRGRTGPSAVPAAGSAPSKQVIGPRLHRVAPCCSTDLDGTGVRAPIGGRGQCACRPAE